MSTAYKKLKEKKKMAHKNTMEAVHKYDELSKEYYRVADVARNADTILDNLDKEFEQITKLTKADINFLFLATALQCVRQYVFSSEKFRLSAKQGDQLVKESLKNVTPKSVENILFSSVPYDAITRTEEMIQDGLSTGLSGVTHRYRTLGHDPILGWIFGTVNIISDSLTKSDIITTYAVQNNRIMGLYPAGTLGAFSDTATQIQKTPYILPAAVAKQAIHFGSDYFTKQGLPVPIVGTINPDLAKDMVLKYNIDLYSITRSATMATLINMLISCIHQLFYQESLSKELYTIRTKKIITYSNTIASSSNILYVAITNDLKKLDVGGMMVTIYNLISNWSFQKKIKQEFLEQEFYKIVMGEK